MKKVGLFLLVSIVSCNFMFAKEVEVSKSTKPKLKLVDKIVARVNGVNILKSDLKKIRISKSGQPFTLQETITDELLLQKAVQRKLVPTELDVEKQIVALKINNGLTDLTDSQFEEELKQEGFTIQEYKGQLARMLAVEKLKHAEFNERVVVTSQEVEEYYKNNPIKIEEKYLLKMCELPKDSVNKDGKLVKKTGLKWDDLGWINKSDLSSSLKFVCNMKKSQVYKPMEIGAGYQMIKLEDKHAEHIKNLDDSYVEIERILHNQKKERFEKVFEKELRGKATLVYLK